MSERAPLEGVAVRASDRDRSRVVDELRRHCVEGRITVDELDRRALQAMSASTIHELAELVVDLPSVSTPEEARLLPARERVGPPGVRPFTRRIVVPARVERTRAVALDTIASGLNGYGYELVRQTPQTLVFERTRRSSGWLAAVLFFPLGLLALRPGGKERLTISLESAGAENTMMIVHGSASRRVRKAFAGLRFT